jgi:WD40 repeat protein
VATGQELRRYIGHTDAVTAVAFAPDGKHILTGSADRTARLWLTDVQEVIHLVCSLLQRDLTAEERAAYSITDETPTCPKP